MIRYTTCLCALTAILLVCRFAEAADSGPTNATANVETNATPSVVGTNTSAAEVSISQDALRSFLHIQEELRKTQVVVEQSRQEAEAAAARNAELLEARLVLLEKSLTAERDELREMQVSNRMVLNAAGVFASIACVVLLFTAVLHWSSVRRLTMAVTSVRSSQALPEPTAKALGMGVGALDESTRHFLGTIEQIEKRIHELEAALGPPSLAQPASPNGQVESSSTNAIAEPNGAGPLPDSEETVSALLGKGETMLKLDQAAGALECFDAVLTHEPGNAEAFVRKGLALERLQRLEEALACYDRAIAADGFMTMAYLYKGGVFNRLERYSEALECYEKALKSQDRASREAVG